MIHRTIGGAGSSARSSAGGSKTDGRVVSLASLPGSVASSAGAADITTPLDFLRTTLDLDAACFLSGQGSPSIDVTASTGRTSAIPGALSRLRSLASRAAMTGRAIAEEAPFGNTGTDAFSAVAAPVSTSGRSTSAVVGFVSGRRPFTQDDLKLVSEVARLISDALAATPAAAPATAPAPVPSSQPDAVQMLTRLLALISQATTEEELLSGALDSFMQVCQADMGSVTVPDPRTGRPMCRGLAGTEVDFAGPAAAAAVREGAFTGGTRESIALYVLRSGVALQLPSNSAPPHLCEQMENIAERHCIGSVLCIPVKTRERHIAVVSLARTGALRPFAASDVDLLQTAADQVAVAVERIRLANDLRKRSLHLATLVEVGRTITSKLDPGVVAEQIAVQIRNLTRTRASMLFYYDNINDRVRLAAQSGLGTSDQEQMLELGAELAQAAAQYNAITCARELRSPEARKRVARLGAGGWIAVPFRHRGHRIAVAVAVSSDGRSPDTEAGELLEQFGSLASVAIQNARVYNRQQAMARVMQESILMSKPVNINGLDIGHRLIPAHEVGGDYYDFIELKDGSTGLVIADVCGSNVRAATYITIGKNALRAYAREYVCPAEVLSRLNRMVCEESAAESFISLFYGVIDPSRSRITYAVAGHEPPVLYRAACSRCEMLGAPGMLLGVARSAEFKAQTRTLAPGDLIAMYTDGLTEVRVNRKAFGVQRLKGLLRSNCGRPAQEIADAVITSRMRFSENRIPDDMALVVLKPTA